MNSIIKTVSAAALVASFAGSAFAGSLAATNSEPAPQQDDGVFAPATGSGISAPVIVGALVAAAVIAGVAGSDDDAPTTTTGAED